MPRPVGREVTDSSVIAEVRDQYVAVANASGNAIAAAWMPRHFDRIDATLRSLEKMRASAEPVQLEALATFAARAYRRPLTRAERDGLLAYYEKLRKQGALSHEDAMRDSVASILISPDFLYRADLRNPATGSPGLASSPAAIPLSGYDLASRLSYFLWSSMPDQELLNHAAAGDLSRRDVLIAQARRMLKNASCGAMERECDWTLARRTGPSHRRTGPSHRRTGPSHPRTVAPSHRTSFSLSLDSLSRL